MNMSIDNKVFNCNNLQRSTQDVQLHQQLVAASFGGAVSAIVSKYPTFPSSLFFLFHPLSLVLFLSETIVKYIIACPFDVVKTRLQIAPTVTTRSNPRIKQQVFSGTLVSSNVGWWGLYNLLLVFSHHTRMRLSRLYAMKASSPSGVGWPQAYSWPFRMLQCMLTHNKQIKIITNFYYADTSTPMKHWRNKSHKWTSPSHL